mmetsp:Transcript_112034/g.280688  ORF Transcript_112034/g.280688 Transcript_112034/m.280688 type:complete len:208 (-) Transcript_112034:1636-2259(-)
MRGWMSCVILVFNCAPRAQIPARDLTKGSSSLALHKSHVTPGCISEHLASACCDIMRRRLAVTNHDLPTKAASGPNPPTEEASPSGPCKAHAPSGGCGGAGGGSGRAGIAGNGKAPMISPPCGGAGGAGKAGLNAVKLPRACDADCGKANIGFGAPSALFSMPILARSTSSSPSEESPSSNSCCKFSGSSCKATGPGKISPGTEYTW